MGLAPAAAFAGPSATKLGFIVEPSNVLAGSPITPAIQVALQANNGSTVTTASDTVTLSISTNPEGGTLSGTTSVAAVNGVATFSDLRIDRPGVGYTLWAWASSGTLTDATSAAFEVIAPGMMLAPARWMTPATLLPNGKVLLAGGYDGMASSAAANLFDSSTGTWSPVTPMATARRAPSTAFLPNGKALVAGGYTGSIRLTSAELYDPATGTWSPTGSLSEGRSGATATVLRTGKVLVVGGYGTGVVATAELYDPASGTWTLTGATAIPRDGNTATLLPDGRVLVTGGYTPSDATYHSTAELYDPVSGVWSPAGSMSTARAGHTATLLPNGKVLVVGGHTSSRLASADLYDPVAGTWTPTGPLTGARDDHTATLLPNGKVLVVGGYDLAALNTTEVYDPSVGTWSAGPTLKAARYGHNATLLPDGRVLIAGGGDTAGVVARSEILTSANGSWSSTGSLSYTGGGGLAAALLPNGTVLVSGGSTNVTTYSTANYYDPAAGAFSSAGSMLAARSSHTLTLLLDGKVLAVGGSSTQVRTELYDPGAKSWSWTGSLTSARSRHTATLLPDGKVLIVGGTQNGSVGLASAEVYDPAAGTWSAAGTLSVGRYNHTATLLSGGRVLVAGGEGAGGAIQGVEVYDSVSGTWSTTGSLMAPHARHTATLLPDGKVLVAGGWDASPLASCELYDPASGTWSLADAMAYARSLHTAALLPNGRVLVMSGTNGGALSACELYDPSSGTWSNTSGASSRYAHTSASLADGRVLLVGGLASGTSPLSTAYVYDEGRGASSAWAPTLSGPLADTAAGAMVAVAGTRFTGISEAHSGSTSASSHNFPLFRFERQEAGEVAWMTLTAFSTTTASIRVPASAQPGTYWVRPFVNGIAGTAQPLRVTSGTTDTTPPTAPGVPSGTPNPSNGDVVVTWGASTDEGSGLKDYAVEVSNDNKATWSAPIWVVGNSFTHAAPAQGSWWYRVKARDNALNTSAAVVSASAVLVDSTPPGAPGAPSGSPDPGAGSDVTVTWAASSGDTGGSGLVGYTVEVSNDGMLSWDPPVSVAGTSWTQLSPAQGSYWYRVTALDDAGNASAVVSAAAVVVDTTAPGAPGAPASSPNPSAGQDVVVSWAASSGDTGGAGFLGYTVEVSSDGKASWSAPVSVGTATDWTHVSPAPGSYWYRVTALDQAGNGASSLSASAQEVIAPSPVNITVGPQVNVAPFQVTLWWETDVTSTTEVHYGPTSQATPAGYAKHSVWSSLAGSKHSRTLCNLAPGTYYYRVQSVGAGSQVAYSSEGTFVVPVPSGSPLDQFVLDDAVRAVANIGNTVYFGGDFTEVLPRRGAGLSFDATAGVVYDDLPMVAGQVNAVVADGQGGFYIGGDFQYVGGIARPYLAHILPDMGLDPGFSPVLDGRVESLAMAGGTLYLGGSFSKVNGVTRGNAAALDASGALTAWNPNVAGPVQAMAPSGGVIYLAGNFSLVNGATSRRNAAAVDATTGVVTAWNPNLNGSVYAIATSGSVVYLGGWFTTANGGTTRNYAAAVDATTGLLTVWDPNPSSYVLSLAASGSSVYLGGTFTTVNGTARNYAAAVDPTSGALMPWDPGVDNQVRSMALSGGTIYLAGGFSSVNGGTARKRAAAVDAATGAALPWDPRLAGFAANAIAVGGGKVWVGGEFASANPGTPRNRAAAVDGTTGALTEWNPDLSSAVQAMVASGNTLYVGGSFTKVNGATTRMFAAAIDATTGIATAWNPRVNSAVYALATAPGLVYLGGLFTTVNGGTSRNRAAAVDEASGNLTSWNPDLNGSVYSLAVVGGTVYLGGAFTTANGGTARNRAAAVDAATGALSAWDPDLNGSVYALAADGSTLYVGGAFTTANGGTAARNAVGVDAATGALTSWRPEPDGSVVALAHSGGTVLLAGGFSTVGGATRRNLGAVDASSGLALSWNPNAYRGPLAPARNAAIVPIAGLGKVYFALQSVLGAGSTPQQGMLTLELPTDGTAPTDPGVPVGAPSPTNGSVTVSWTASTDADSGLQGYEVRLSSDDKATWSAPVSVATNSYTHASPVQGTWWYQVTAKDNAGNASAPVASTEGVVVDKTAPSGLSPVAGAPSPTRGDVTVSWAAASDTGGAGLKDYQVEGSSDGKATWSMLAASVGPGTTSWTHGSPAQGSWWYRVTAQDYAGNAFSSVSASGVVVDKTGPGAPGVPVGSPNPGNGANVLVTWAASSGDSGGSGPSGYTIEVSNDGMLSWDPPVSVAGTSWTQLSPAHGAYWYRVTALDNAGNGAAAISASPVIVDRAGPTGPGTPSGSPNPSNGAAVTVSWTASTDVGGTGLKDYAVEISSNGGTSWSAPVYVATNSYTHAAPAQGSYLYRVTARDNVLNASAPATSASAVVVDRTAPANPGTPGGSPNPGNGADVLLSWTASTDVGGTGLKDYGVEISSDGGASWSAPVYVATNSYTHATPAQGSYLYRVTARDNVLNASAPTTSASAVVVDKTAPANPGTPSGTPNPSNGADVTVSWTASTDAGGTGLRDYAVEISSNGGTSWSAPVYVATNSYTHAAPAQGSYLYRVTARDNVLNLSAPVTSAAAVVVDSSVPTNPGTPSGSPSPGNGADVLVSWTAATDLGAGLKDYGVEISSDGGASWSAPAYVTTNSYTHAAPAQGSYLYRVTARDNVLNASAPATSASAVVVDKSAPTNPGTPGGAPNPSNGADVTVSWTASTDAGGAGLKDYRVEISSNGGTSWSAPVYVTTNSYTHTAPAQGSYLYRVTARDNVLNLSAPVTSAAAVIVDKSAPTSPGAPSAIPNPGNGADVTVSWAASTDSGGAGLKDYGVEVSSNGGTSWSAPVYVATNSYAHAAPAQGSYLYRVTARDNVLNLSAPAASAAAVIVDKTAPTTPGAPSGNPNPGNGADVTVSWAASTDAGGAGLKDYGVEVSSNGGTSWSAPVYVATNSFTHAAPAQGSYLYRVTARDNVLNASTPAIGASAVVVDKSAPTSPGTPSGSPNPGSGADVVVSWTASTDAGGTGLKDYGVEISGNGGTSWSAPVYVATNSYTHAAPAQGSYLYRVTARDAVLNASAPATSASAVVVDKTAPTNPGTPSGTPNPGNGADVTVSWTASSDGGGAGLKDYGVEISSNGGTSWSAPVYVATNSYAHAAPAQGSYHYRVTARDDVLNLSTPVTSAVAVVVDTTAPTNPGAPSGSPNPGNGADVTVSWAASTDAGGAGLKDYGVEISSNGGTSWSAPVYLATNSYTHAAPAQGSYLYRVTARDNVLNLSAPVASVVAVVVDTSAPANPGVPSGSPNPGNGADVVVSWAASTDLGAGLKDYAVEISSNGGTSWSAPVYVATNSYTHAAPAQGSHLYRVTARDNVLNLSAPATSASAVVVDKTAPANPGTPSGTPNPSNGADVTVSWTAATDAGGAGLKDYAVEVSSNGGTSWSAPVYVATNSYTHAAPAQGSYLYRVTARDNVLNLSAPATSASGVVVDRTGPTNPGAPSGTPNPSNGADLTVSWAASTDAGGAGLKDYAVEVSSTGGASWSAPVHVATNSYAHAAPAQGSYLYRITARDHALNTSVAVTSAVPVVVDKSAPTSPGTPSGSPNPGSGADVTVSWAASSDLGAGLKDYAVEVSGDAGVSWSAPIYVATNSYTHAAPAQGSYLFRVTARDNVLNASASATSAAVVVDKTAPTGLDPIVGSPAFTNGDVTVSWTAAVDTGGSALVDYQVQASNDGRVSWSAPVAVALPTTSWTHLAPAEGSWWYRVTARDAAGNARVVDSVAPVLVDRVAPSEPSDVAGAPTPSNGDVTVTWTSSADTGSGVKDYLIETSADGKATWQSGGTVTVPSYTQAGPDEGTYFYRVTARDQAGNASAPVVGATGVVVDRTAPSGPGVPSGTPNPATGDVLVSWAAAGDGGGAGLSGYVLEISADEKLSWSAPLSVADASWVQVAPAEGRYWYRVTAQDQAGNVSPPSISLVAVVVDRTAPSAPGLPSASPNPSRGDVTVSWSAATDGGAGIASYVLETSSDGGASWSAPMDVGATSYVHASPAQGTWRYRVRARDAAGNLGAASTSLPVVVDRTAPSTPGTPSNSYDPGSGQVAVSWAASSDGGGSGFAYRLERSADGGGSWSVPTTVGSNAYTDSGLPPGSYLYRITAVDGAGNASVSAVSAAPVVVDPSLPVAGLVRDGLAGDLQFQASTSSLSANWSGFADPESGITGYEWAIGTTAGGSEVRSFVSVGTAIQATANGLDLLEGTTYFVRVRATNGAGRQTEASSDGVMVDGAAPTAGLVADGASQDADTQASTSTLAANWSGFSDAGSGLASYSWAIGSSVGATDVRGFTSVGTNTSASASGLSLVNGLTYFVTVRAYDRAGLYTDVSSDGVRVVVPFFSVRLSGPVSPTQQGEAHDLRLEVLDGLGATAAGYQGTLRLTSSDPLAQLPAEVAFTAADGGIKDLVQAVAFWTAGTQSLTATDSANPALAGSLGSIEVSEALAPGIVREANGRGAVGVPYRYSALGRVRAAGSTPILFASCGGPSGFTIAPLDGSVRWTPTQAGVVSLCVAAQNSAGRAEYLFDVDVAASAPPGPRAVVDVAPPSGPAPLAVRLSGAGSSVDPGAGALMYRWDFGDGSADASGRDVQHVYALSGSFRPTLTVWDAFGSSAIATGSVSALGAGGQTPPSVRILASALEGQDSLTVDLRAEVAAGSAPIRGYLWHLRDGETATTLVTRATFGPGRWPVVLEVADASGLSSQDRVEIVVRRGSSPPPECRVRVTPAAGVAPLTARWSADASTHDGAAPTLTWQFNDGTTSNLAEVQRAYGTAGAVFGRLRVEDGTGLACEDLVRLEVLSAAGYRAPRILSGPLEAARCGANYPQDGPPARLTAVGEGPLRWTLVDGPEGLALDGATGAIRWSPDPSLSGPVSLTVAVENSVGRAERSFELPVECPSELAFEVVGCGCGSGQGGTWLPFALVGLLAGARRSRSRAGARGDETRPGDGR